MGRADQALEVSNLDHARVGVRGPAARSLLVVTVLALIAAGCAVTGVEEARIVDPEPVEPVVVDDPDEDEDEVEAGGPLPCRHDNPARELNEELLSMLPDAQEAWERLGLRVCVQGGAATGMGVLEPPLAIRAKRVFADAEFLDRFEDSFEAGTWVAYWSAGGPRTGGVFFTATRFDDESVARDAVPLLLQARLELAAAVATPVEPVREIAADELGDESVGVRGTVHRGELNVHYVWRRGDLLLVAAGWARDSDGVDEQAILEFARAIDHRAR
jgi:hypothetical protein